MANKFDAMRKAEKSAWSRCSAYIILNKDGTYGKIKCAHPVDGMGPLHVFIWGAVPSEMLYQRVSGCGFDKLQAALDHVVYQGVPLDNKYGWETALREAGHTVIYV